MIGELSAEASLGRRRRRNDPNLSDSGEFVLPLGPWDVAPVKGKIGDMGGSIGIIQIEKTSLPPVHPAGWFSASTHIEVADENDVLVLKMVLDLR